MDCFFVVPNNFVKEQIESRRQQFASSADQIFFSVENSGNIEVIRHRLAEKMLARMDTYVRNPESMLVSFLIGYPLTDLERLRRILPAILIAGTPTTLQSKSQAARVVGFIQSELSRVRRLLGALKKELQERDSKTPLLLPLRNFDSTSLNNFLVRIQELRTDETDYTPVVRKMVDRLVEDSLDVRSEDKRTAFIGTRSIAFLAPAKAGPRHGSAQSVKPPHNPICLIDGHFRLGVRYDARFHYDCSISNRRISGQFSNCHDAREVVSPRAYLNIAPNDFLRL
jgi:hypothetical protein